MSIISEALRKAGEGRRSVVEAESPPQGGIALKEGITLPEAREIGKAKVRRRPNALVTLAAILIVFSIVLAWNLFHRRLSAAPVRTASAENVSAPETASSETTLTQQLLDKAARETSPPVSTVAVDPLKPPSPSLALNGIMYSTETSYAIINNSMVQEGDTVGGAKVAKINRGNVVLVYKDRETILTLKK